MSASGPRRRAIIAAIPVAAGLAACTSPRQPQPAALDFFTEHQAAVVEAATARIAPGPRDDPAEAGHPGAREADVTGYIDTMLGALDDQNIFAGGPVARIAWRKRIIAWQDQYAKGISRLDKLAGGDFTKKPPAQQDKILATPSVAGGDYDLITAFRFFLNAEPPLRRAVLAWMRASLRPRGLVVVNFHLNPFSLRGIYLRLRMNPAETPAMMNAAGALRLFTDSGFRVRQILGYSYLPYRRDGRNLRGAATRRAAETRLAGNGFLRPIAGSFLLVASAAPAGPDG